MCTGPAMSETRRQNAEYKENEHGSRTMRPSLSRMSANEVVNARMAMISDATEMSKPAAREWPTSLAPMPIITPRRCLQPPEHDSSRFSDRGNAKQRQQQQGVTLHFESWATAVLLETTQTVANG